MKSIEFAYWLQGYFEIGTSGPIFDSQPVLTPMQAARVATRLATVEPTKDVKLANLIKVVGECIAALQVEDAHEGQAVLTKVIKTKLIQDTLNDTFIHAIDPAIPGDQQQQRNLHRPKGPATPGGFEAMC